MKEINARYSNQRSVIATYVKVLDMLALFSLILIVYAKEEISNNTNSNRFFMFVLSCLFFSIFIFKTLFITMSQFMKNINLSEKFRDKWFEDMSHDIKTPLSSIKGYAEIIQETTYSFTSDELKLYGFEIKKAEQRIENMIEDLKMSKKLKEGKIILKKERVDLCDLIRECISEIDSALIGNSKIIFDIKQEIYYICDRKLIKRTMENIIQNAFIHNDKSIELYINIEITNKKIYICIKDNGKGISKEECGHIFERYYRCKESERIKGQGLGLSIVYEIIKAHKGTIKVNSIKNLGTEFIIELG